jgi:hypothetical protein
VNDAIRPLDSYLSCFACVEVVRGEMRLSRWAAPSQPSILITLKTYDAIARDFCSEITTRQRRCSRLCASRFESCRPLAVEALRLALTPTTNQMRSASPCPRPVAAHYVLFKDSMIDIVAIPGMMTGAILSGANVEQAARSQMIITFMISASSALSGIVATLFTLSVFDSEHRICGDRIDTEGHTLLRAWQWHHLGRRPLRAMHGSSLWAG